MDAIEGAGRLPREVLFSVAMLAWERIGQHEWNAWEALSPEFL
jgi:hypothetical protein